MTRATFAVAVPQRFTSDVSLGEISAFVATIRTTFYDRLDLIATEYLIRIALGEDLPEPPMGVWDEILAKTLVLGALADYWNSDEGMLASAVVQAERTSPPPATR